MNAWLRHFSLNTKLLTIEALSEVLPEDIEVERSLVDLQDA